MTLTTIVLQKGCSDPTILVRLALPGYQRMLTRFCPEPGTRVHTVHEDSVPPTQSRSMHPFAYNAYNAKPSIPFSSLVGDPNMDPDLTNGNHGARRPESEGLSRGAGMRSLNYPQDAIPAGRASRDTYRDESGASGESPEKGTPGKVASQGRDRPKSVVSFTVLIFIDQASLEDANIRFNAEASASNR